VFLTGNLRDSVKLAADVEADLLVIGATGHSAMYERMWLRDTGGNTAICS
jgi:nucleotide-binding universal stress UspA family protein